MRKYFVLISVALVFGACSTAHYAYNFDYYDYQSGKKKKVEGPVPGEVVASDGRPLNLRGQDLAASVAPTDPVVEPRKELPVPSFGARASHYKDMSKKERRGFRKEVRNEIKNYAKELQRGDHGASTMAAKELDDELKLAIIFGAVGITFAVLGGINTIFWVLGIIGLVVGLIFFIRWIQTQ